MLLMLDKRHLGGIRELSPSYNESTHVLGCRALNRLAIGEQQYDSAAVVSCHNKAPFN